MLGKTDTKKTKVPAERPPDQKKKRESGFDRPRRVARAMHRLSR